MNDLPQVVQITIKPKGWLSHLLWRFIRYEMPKNAPIYLTLIPPPDTEVRLQATWLELPLEEAEHVE